MPSEIPLTCKVPEAWLEEIDHYAQSQGLSRADVLKAAIAHLLDLQDPNDWSAHFAQLEQHLTKLSKQVTVLHKRLRTVEGVQQSLTGAAEAPQFTAAVAPPSLPPQPTADAQQPSLNGPGLSVPLAESMPLTSSSPAAAPPSAAPRTATAPSLSLPTPPPTPPPHPSGLAHNTIIDTVEGELLPHDAPPRSFPPTVTPELLSGEPERQNTPARDNPMRRPRSASVQPLPSESWSSESLGRAPRAHKAAPNAGSPSSFNSNVDNLAAKASRPRPKTPPLGMLNLEELCRLNRMNPLTIQSKADAVGLTLAEAIELETGWKYDPRTKTYTPPI